MGYIGLIHKDTDSHFGVSFPDFPGVVTAGTNLDDARAMAEEALTFHIEGLVQDGEAIPEPSALEEIMSDPDNRSGVAILVSVKNGNQKPFASTSLCPEIFWSRSTNMRKLTATRDRGSSHRQPRN
jgi:predicted RNase H-like HicB family nuclease